ncbi:unnamed protein product [Rotaria sordida]|uniref:Uncharacterized protein n=1 Tax=Rotaria sordida TaxID=392033 RepID=A0A813UCH2_9BILA|nr:unnamed protein product [Rotaria sordida]
MRRRSEQGGAQSTATTLTKVSNKLKQKQQDLKTDKSLSTQSFESKCKNTIFMTTCGPPQGFLEKYQNLGQLERALSPTILKWEV